MPIKIRILVPSFISVLLRKGIISVDVLKSNDTWYGMTYQEDAENVKDSFKSMINNEIIELIYSVI